MTVVGRGARIVAAVVASLALLACGAPTGSPARTIGTVPYDLTVPPATASPATTPTVSHGPQVYLVRDEALLAASPVPRGADVRGMAARALQQLAEGPSDQDRAVGMSTALGPEVRLSLVDLANGRATVDILAGQQAPGAGRLPLAVGQVVLTLSSIEGVDEVVLTSDGTRIAAPLPGGALTDQPLTARDYAELTKAPTSSDPGPGTPGPP